MEFTHLWRFLREDNWLDVKKVIADAKKERVEANKVARCKNCSCSVEERCSDDDGGIEQS